MDYKKKYNEAQKWIESIYSELSHEQQMEAEAFFPELKESEDEKMMHQLHSWMKEFGGAEEYTEKVYTWLKSLLEKQGEQKSIDKEYTFKSIPRLLDMIEPTDRAKSYCKKLIDSLQTEGYSIDAKIVGECLKQMNGEKVAMAVMDIEKQGEQKPADKVEPKFKIGDWVIDKQDIVHQIANVIENVTNHTYGYDIVGGGYFNDNTEGVRLWTINDAKDGDVLACPLPKGCESGEQIFIFKGINSRDYVDNCIEYYCRICEGVFYENENGYMGTTSSPLYPATKEQRDALFAKMKEAGYEWDAEKKELKKSADKQKFKVGDYVVISTTKGDKVVQIASVEYLKGGYPSYITTEGRWFGNGTKARILTNKDMETITIPGRSTIVKKIKSWSEDDETKMRAALAFIKSEFPKNGDEEIMEGTIEWLKSLKQRIGWKPSDEQMIALSEASGIVGMLTPRGMHLQSLYNDLKKLTE